jgi:uncharacterized protein
MKNKLMELTNKIEQIDRETLLSFGDTMDEKYVSQIVEDLSQVTGTDDIEVLRLSIGVQLANLGVKMMLEPEKGNSLLELMEAAAALKRTLSTLIAENCVDLTMSALNEGRTTESQTSDSESEKEG